MTHAAELLVKLLVLAGIAVYLKVSSRWMKGEARPLLPIFLVAAVRDIIYVFFPQDVVCFASDAIIILTYLLWVHRFTGWKPLDAAAAAFTVVGVAGSALPLFGMQSPFLAGLFYRSVWTLPALGVVTYRLLAVSSFNARNAELVEDLRRPVIVLLSVVFLFTIVLGYASDYMHAFIYPVAYALHGGILFMLGRADVERRDDEIEALKDDKAGHFTFMEKLSSAVGEKIEIEKMLAIVVESAMRDTGADGGAILLLDGTKGTLCFRAVAGSYAPPFAIPAQVMTRVTHLDEYLRSREVEVGATLLGESFKTAAPVFVQDVAKDGRLARECDNAPSLPSSIIVAPLLVAHRILGVISVTMKSWGQYFRDDDFVRLKAFADYASLSIDMHLTYLEVLEKRQIEHEMGIAAEIQQKLISYESPSSKNAELAVLSVPAHGVNGDYFHLLPYGETTVGFVVGDVAGKGIAAALVMVMIHSMLNLIASPRRDLAQTLMWINRGLIGQVEIDHYATLSILAFDPAAHRIKYSNAAHHPLMILRADSGQTEVVDTSGLPIGIDAATTYEVKDVAFAPGDVALVYTDGIVEALNPAGEQYSLERLSSLVRAHCNRPAQEIRDVVRRDLADFVQTARQHDDQTLVILKAV